MAQPPTYTATPVLRAGLTEAFVTGMRNKWMRVRLRPMAMPAKPLGACVGRPHDDEEKGHGHDDLGDGSGHEGVATQRMLAVAVGGEPIGEAESCRPAGDQIEDAACGDAAQDLRYDVGQRISGGESTAGPQAKGDGRVDVTAGDMTDGVGHGQNGEAKGEADAK